MPTHYSGTPEETQALDVFIKFTRAAQSLENRLAERGSHGSLTPTQFGVLEALYHLGPLCPGMISEKVLKSNGNLTLVIDNLEKRALVRRQRQQDDRRMVRIHLTEAGRTLIAGLLPGHVAAIVEEIGVLTPAEQHSLAQLCRKLGRHETT